MSSHPSAYPERSLVQTDLSISNGASAASNRKAPRSSLKSPFFPLWNQRDAFEWDVVENGFSIPMKDGKPKSHKNLSPEKVNAMNSNAKAINSLLNGMVATKLRKVSACTTAKHIWDTINVSHEGTSKVREVKLSMLMSDYEDFRLERNEIVRDAQGRFLTLMNSISLMEMIIPQSEINRNILGAIPEKFALKLTILQDSTLLSTMDTITLFSELEEFENQLRRYDDEDEAPHKKTLALNAETAESPDDSDEEIAILTKKFHKFHAKTECLQTTYEVTDCYKLKNKKKALITWSDDESDVEIDSDDKVAQLCFAGLETAPVTMMSEIDDPMKDEALVAENKSLLERISKLTEENQYLKNEIEMKDVCLKALKKESIFIDPETVKRDSVPDPLVLKLKQKVAQLEKDLAKCFHGEGTLNALLGEQKSSPDKGGLGCESIKKCAFQGGYKRAPIKYGLRNQIDIYIRFMILTNQDPRLSGYLRDKAIFAGDKSKFLSLVAKEGGLVTLGDSNTVIIIGKGTIGNDMFAISNVRLVDGLKYNLISVSQLTDAGHKVKFDKDVCYIGTQSNEFAFIAKRKGNIFVLDFDEQQEEIFLAAVQDQQNLWHRRLGHVHMDLLRKISSHDLVRGLPKLKFKKVEPFTACQLGRPVKTSFIAKNHLSKTDPLQLLYLDHFGPERYVRLGGKNYAFVIADDYSRFTWVLYLRTKDEAFDHIGEFEKDFITFCKSRGITHEFSSPRTPQQNGVVERKNRTLQETARTLLHENTQNNRGKFDAKSTEGIFLGYSTTSKAYRVYNSVKNKLEESINITFNESSRNISQIDEDTTDLSSHSKIRQSLSQKRFTQASDDSYGSPKTPDSVSNVIFVTPLDNSSQAEMRSSNSNETTPIQFQADNSNEEEMSNVLLPKSSKIVKNHPPDNLLTDLGQGISTRSRLHNLWVFCAFVAEFQPKNAQEAVADEHWSMAMQEELNHFERCDV
ncbi:hypothetical protein AgCh_022884 [Apium graveolens]